MANSDYVTKQASTGIASSSDYNTNMKDFEDINLDGWGAGVISGGTASDSGGLVATIAASTYFIGIKLSKGSTNVNLINNATNRIWAVTDPDNADRVVYVVKTDATIVSRAVKIAEIITSGGVITSIDNNMPDKWARPLENPLIPQQDKFSSDETQTIHKWEQVLIFEDLIVDGNLIIEGRLRVEA